jgi:poly(3-hydroxybutyrate) depolymerase
MYPSGVRPELSSGAVATNEGADVAETERFLLVVPNGTHPATGDTRGDCQGWNDGRVVDSPVEPWVDDVAFLTELLDRIERDYSIDGGRIYVTGASNGGMMTFRLLMEVTVAWWVDANHARPENFPNRPVCRDVEGARLAWVFMKGHRRSSI